MRILFWAMAGLATFAFAIHLQRNRLLALALPRLRQRLKERFGEQAGLTSIWLDTSWRLRVEQLTIPFSNGVTILAVSGWVGGLPRLALSQFQGAAILEDVCGVVKWESPTGPVQSPAAFTGQLAFQPFALRGKLTAAATWAQSGDSSPLAVSLASSLDVTAAEAHAGELVLKIGPAKSSEESEPARVEGEVVASRDAAGSAVELSADLRAWNVAGAILTQLLSAALPALDPRLPEGLVVDGNLQMRGPTPPAATLVAVTPHSKVSLRGTLDLATGLVESKLTGHVALRDLTALRHGPTTPQLHSKSPLQIDATIGGPLTRLVLEGKAAISELEFTAGTTPHRFLEVSSDIRIEGRRIEWRHLTAGYAGGKVRSSGHADFELRERSYGAQIHWLDVRTERIPAGKQAVGNFVRAAASGELRLKGSMGRSEKLTGQGVLTLSDPEYPAVKLAEAALSRYGLPLPAAKGTRPARCRITLAGSRVEAKAIEGFLDGIKFDGQIGFLLSGELVGRLDLHVDSQYLSKSTMLAFPAAALTRDVVVPVTLSGTVLAPVIQADVGGTLGGLLRNMTGF